jgi:uncharacterized protein (TIGR02145 family)
VPTVSEIDKLGATSSIWITQHGVSGRLFGSDSTTVFLLAADSRNFSNGTLYRASTSYYWSSTSCKDDKINAYYVFLYKGDALVGIADRNYGFSVRCVIENSAHIGTSNFISH